MDYKEGLKPVISDNARILILGSLPGDESLKRQEYYGNPRNLFWKVIGNAIGETVPTEYAAKVEYLKAHGIALWDVFKAAEREGSLDANIINEEFNDIAGLLEKYPNIDTIALNGGKSAKAFSKYLRRNPQLRKKRRIIECKSTSAMILCSGWTLESLSEDWKKIFE